MKHIQVLVLTALLSGTFLSPRALLAQGAGGGAPVTLQWASAQGSVEYRLTGTGGSSGDAVALAVRRTARAGSTAMTITIPPGSRLRSSDADEQDMVVGEIRGIALGGGYFRPATRVTLRDNAWVTLVVSAFCASFEKDNPSTGTTFTLQPPDPALACILTRGRALSIPARQAAVWMYTDRITFAHMREKFDVQRSDWMSAQAVVQWCAGRQ